MDLGPRTATSTAPEVSMHIITGQDELIYSLKGDDSENIGMCEAQIGQPAVRNAFLVIDSFFWTFKQHKRCIKLPLLPKEATTGEKTNICRMYQ